MERRHLPPRPDRAAQRPPDQPDLTRRVGDRGRSTARLRVAVEEMYPAGCPGVVARLVRTPGGFNARVVEAGARDAPPVLLLHGLGASAYGFRFLLAALAAAGMRGIALDLPGHGVSDKPLDRQAYHLDGLVRRVLEVMDVLRLERVAVVGHSLGGAIALQLALAEPERVSRVAAISPVGYARVRWLGTARQVTRALGRRIPELATRAVFAAALRRCYGLLGVPTARDVDEYFAPSADRRLMLAFAAALHVFPFYWCRESGLGALRAPLQIVSGTADRVLDWHGQAQLAATADRCELVLVDGAGHLPHEEAPEQVHAPLLGFLARATIEAPRA